MAVPATQARAMMFHGWKVVWAAFVLAVFGWGLGFYGPPVFLKVLHEQRGWSIALISTAVTIHFLVGAVSGANLPALHRRFGATPVTRSCAIAMASGLILWAAAREPWQMFVAALLSGCGWGGMSAAALNAIVAPWFVRGRPAALGMAYNGGSIGGVIFSPLWVASIGALGFANAATAIAVTMITILWLLSGRYFTRTPEQMALKPDSDVRDDPPSIVTSPHAKPLPGSLLWQDWRFVTLSAAMALGLFAQIGLIAHLYSLLAPALGSQQAGFAMAVITAMAIAGRTSLGWIMPIGADRRLVACAGYLAQLLGSVMFYLAGGQSVPLLFAGVVLFGLGFGNATSLPPLIAQVEFSKNDITRAVALVIGMAQAAYAFAPATFGLIRAFSPKLVDAPPGAAPCVFLVAALLQGFAIVAFVAGRGDRGDFFTFGRGRHTRQGNLQQWLKRTRKKPTQ
jgi:Major Facilitator Superfamily